MAPNNRNSCVDSRGQRSRQQQTRTSEKTMSECSICGEYCDCLHPVDFHTNPKKPTPKEIQQYIGLGGFIDDLDASEAEEEFWENCAHICHECFNKYLDWIQWWG